MAAPLPPLTFYHTEGDLSRGKCYKSVTNLLHFYELFVTNLLQIVTKMLQKYYKSVTNYYKSITKVLQKSYGLWAAGPPIVTKMLRLGCNSS